MKTRRLLILPAVILLAVFGACEGVDLDGTPTPTSSTDATATPTISEPPCPPTAEPFIIEEGGSFEKAIRLEEPTRISAEASWQGGADHLALFLNGPERPELENPEAPYARRDGPSGLLGFDFVVQVDDIERGTNWRVRLVNYETGTAAGCLEVVETPLSGADPTATPISHTGLYQVRYSKTYDSCESLGIYAPHFDDTLDVRIRDGEIAIHQYSTGDDSVGTIRDDGGFTTTGSGPTHRETYEGTIENGRIEADNSFVQLGCQVTYSITGDKQ